MTDATLFTEENLMALSRDVPEPVRRRLRQEAGFGCCICGNPVFQYHHIRGFADGGSHDPDHMMVLCPNHHHEATVGALSEHAQRGWKANPNNIQAGQVDGLLKIVEPGVAVRVGTNDLVGSGFKLVVDGLPVLALDRDEAGRLQLSLDLYDSSDSLLLTIFRNEWLAGDPMPWDVEFSHRRLQLRRKRGEVTLEVDATAMPVRLRGQLWRKGQHFSLDEDALCFNGDVALADLGLVGVQLVADTTTGRFQLVSEPRFGGAIVVSWPDRAERLSRCFQALQQLEAKAV